jgi:hypothetical protein
MEENRIIQDKHNPIARIIKVAGATFSAAGRH